MRSRIRFDHASFMYRQLDPARITETSALLCKRVEERFPQAGLRHVARDLKKLTEEAAAVSRELGRPNYVLRGIVAVCILGLLVLLGAGLRAVQIDAGLGNVSDFAQGIEAVVNDIIFVGVAIYFLTTLEVRIKRRRALHELHALRSMAHIIDMHQLTKDPERVVRPSDSDTASSPRTPMTLFELGRYLDYCSEMLAIIGKIAALYIQHFDDADTVSAASDVETLSSDLYRNVWQKILVIDRPNSLPIRGDE
ncbi:MAG: hypothetical protein IPK60_00140 [Sandaracinaceae bacterium]|nr:hypothetical protein [Sandaracinaceae bacterium]